MWLLSDTSYTEKLIVIWEWPVVRLDPHLYFLNQTSKANSGNKCLLHIFTFVFMGRFSALIILPLKIALLLSENWSWRLDTGPDSHPLIPDIQPLKVPVSCVILISHWHVYHFGPQSSYFRIRVWEFSIQHIGRPIRQWQGIWVLIHNWHNEI